MAIEWDSMVSVPGRELLSIISRVPGALHVQHREATVEDLRRACEAAGLELVDPSWPLVDDLVMESHVLSSQLMRAGLAECDRLRAQHAEDMEKLGSEMSEIVAQRDAAREEARSMLGDHALAREALSAGMGETIQVAARRVVAERDEARARAEKADALAEEVATLRARVAELEAAPQGQPVATDEELVRVGEDALYTPRAWSIGEAMHMVVAAVAARVRAERPACLVARAVALGCDVRLLRNTIDTSLWSLTVGGEAGTRYNIAASEVPGAMGIALDYAERVAAGRKGGA
jgi:hypothetical protein